MKWSCPDAIFNSRARKIEKLLYLPCLASIIGFIYPFADCLPTVPPLALIRKFIFFMYNSCTDEVKPSIEMAATLIEDLIKVHAVEAVEEDEVVELTLQ